MDDARIAQIGYATQELNSELKELNNHVSCAWRSLARVSERLHELLDLYDQLSNEHVSKKETLH